MEARADNSAMMINNQMYQAFNIIERRLDCSDLYEKVERFLKGQQPTMERDEKTGELFMHYIETGESKCNVKGVQMILNKIVGLVNSQIVQGNLTMQRYELLITEFRMSFTRALVYNCLNYGIKDNDLEFIIDYVMDLVELYLTRLIDNEERNSYAATTKVVESNVLKERGGGLNLFRHDS